MILDVKMEDFHRKAHFIAGGHKTELPTIITCAGVVSSETVCLLLMLVSLSDLEFKVAAI